MGERLGAEQLLLYCDSVLTGTFVSDALEALDVPSCVYTSIDVAFAATETLLGEAVILPVEWPPYAELDRARRSDRAPVVVVCAELTQAEVGELTRHGAAVVVTLPQLGDARPVISQVIEYLETWRPSLLAAHGSPQPLRMIDASAAAGCHA
jgi:hypothetical protein